MVSFLSPQGKLEWKAHWPVVAVGLIAYMFSMVHLAAMGLMVEPLEQEFGWSRAQITSGFVIISVLGLPLSPILGRAIDMFGPRRIAIVGVASYCLSLAALSFATSQIWLWWLLWIFVAVAYICIAPTVWVTAITSLFSASRGLALAVILTAGGGTMLIAPITTYFLVENLGWRMAWLAWAGIIAALTLPLLFFFFFSAKDRTRRAAPDLADTLSVSETPLPGLSVKQGLANSDFIKTAIIGAVMTLVISGMLVHFVPILISLGNHPATAAATVGLLGITQVVGRLGVGYMLDHMNARVLGTIAVLAPVVTFLLLIHFGQTLPLVVIGILLMGIAVGAETDILSYVASRLFGLRNFGTLFGVIVGFMVFGSGGGPFVASLFYDRYDSYIPALWAAIPLCILSAYCFATLGPYPDFEGEVEKP